MAAKARNAPCFSTQSPDCVNVFGTKMPAAKAPFTEQQLHLILKLMLDEINTGAFSGIVAGVELHLLDDSRIAEMNLQHFARIGPTNIISFPQLPPMWGILCLSIDTFQRECIVYGQNPREHFIRLLAHGMGHLAGMEHGMQMDAVCSRCMATCSHMLNSEFIQ